MIAKETKKIPVENLKDSKHVQAEREGSARLKEKSVSYKRLLSLCKKRIKPYSLIN
jgi:hypothetical protein